MEFRFPVVDKAETDVRPAQQQLGHKLVDGGRLLPGFFHEAFTHRHVVEQVVHHHCGTYGTGRLPDIGDLSALVLNFQAGFPLRRPGRHRHLGNGGDACQRLTAEPQRGDGVQVLLPADLAGGVAFKGHAYIALVDTAAVVCHPDGTEPAFFDLHGHCGGPGVQAVFHQFLDRRSGPFHNLARRDLADQILTQRPYFPQFPH